MPTRIRRSQLHEDVFESYYTKAEVEALLVAGSGDARYVHEQQVPLATWTINHDLAKHPSVTVVDSAGTVVIGEVQYVSLNSLTVSFSAPFSGTAYCN